MDDSTLAERQAVGTALLGSSMAVKRLCAPMLEHVICQQYLCEKLRAAERDGVALIDLLNTIEVIVEGHIRPTHPHPTLPVPHRPIAQMRGDLDAMLTDLKTRAAGGKKDERHETRLEEWVESVRTQVDYMPGRCAANKGCHFTSVALSSPCYHPKQRQRRQTDTTRG